MQCTNTHVGKWAVPAAIYIVWLGYPAFPGLRKEIYETFVPPPDAKK